MKLHCIINKDFIFLGITARKGDIFVLNNRYYSIYSITRKKYTDNAYYISKTVGYKYEDSSISRIQDFIQDNSLIPFKLER
jgi:hypothetical protein